MESAPIQDSENDETKKILAVSQSINYLGLQLYRELSSEEENVFFSPLSLSTALAILFCGSRGETSEEMRAILGYKEANILDIDVKSCYELLLSSLDKIPDSCTLTSANVVFSQNDFQLKEEFKRVLSESFKAMHQEVDFQNESAKAIQQANDWVNEKTNGMIPRFLNLLDLETVMVILNAVYFKGFWLHRFQKDCIFQEKFYNNGLETNSKVVDMMHLTESFIFVEKQSFKALQLPYEGEEIAMLILLPNSRDGLDELESSLSSDFIANLTTEMRNMDVNVTLPKFRLEYSKSTKPYFQNLGMNSIFNRGADFGGINDSKDLLVSEILHKAVLVVNEEGSEAAAATAVVMMLCSLKLDPDFIVDHPFLFSIYNTKTNLILFMGRVVEL